MSILSWLVFGLVAGLFAHYLDPRPAQGGIAGTVTLGVLGALLGGFLGDLIFGPPAGGGVTGFNLSSLIVAVIGSLILLFPGRMFQERGA